RPAPAARRPSAPRADRQERRAWRRRRTSLPTPFTRNRPSRDNLQRRDRVAFQDEEEPQVHGTAGKTPGQPTGDDDGFGPLFAGERLTRVLVPGRGLLLPLPDGSTPTVGPPLVLYDSIFREAPGNGRAVLLVGGEVGGDGSWQIERHRSSLRVRRTGALA